MELTAGEEHSLNYIAESSARSSKMGQSTAGKHRNSINASTLSLNLNPTTSGSTTMKKENSSVSTKS
ncbi:hypothetical protein ACF0H5_002659 [Mactra antiquata]